MYLYLLCLPSIRSVNNGYIEFVQPTPLSYTHQTRAKTIVPLEIQIFALNTDLQNMRIAEMQNCMKLDSLKAIYCTYPTHVTNRLDFSTYHAALRIQIKRGKNNPVVSDILNNISSSFAWPAKSHNASQYGNWRRESIYKGISQRGCYKAI